MKPDDRATAPGPREIVEEAIGRLLEAQSILEAIERAGLLAELPADADAAQRHQCGVSMLAVLRRDLASLADDLEASNLAQEIIGRLSRSV